MKTICVACVTALSVSSVYAQNSVTLYGVIDEGLGFTNNAGNGQAWQLQSGWVAGSRWGLKGSESLGGGTNAIFTLENGFDLNSGKLSQGGREFGRQAFAGLQSDTAGTVTLGRQYDSMVDYVAPLTSNGGTTGYIFSHPLDNDNLDNTFRMNNSVKYASQNYGGLRFGGLYAFSNQAGAFSNNRGYSFGAAYSGSAISIAAAYMQVNQPGGSQGGALATDDTNFVADRYQVWGAAINYTWSSLVTGFAYTHTTVDSPTSSVYTGTFSIVPASLKFDNFELNAKYQFTPALLLAAMYTFTEGHFDAPSGNAKPKWHQVGLHVDYSLSKRTTLYAQTVYQHVTGGSTGTALDEASIPGAAGISSTSTQVVARIGMRHAF